MVDIEVHGLEELSRDWAPWERRTETALRGALLSSANTAAAVLRVRVPVRTGAFRNSIRVSPVAAQIPTAQIIEGEGIEYARWLEWGRWKRGRGPKTGRYIIPTARRMKRVVKNHLAATTQHEIERYPWPNPK